MPLASAPVRRTATGGPSVGPSSARTRNSYLSQRREVSRDEERSSRKHSIFQSMSAFGDGLAFDVSEFTAANKMTPAKPMTADLVKDVDGVQRYYGKGKLTSRKTNRSDHSANHDNNQNHSHKKEQTLTPKASTRKQHTHDAGSKITSKKKNIGPRAEPTIKMIEQTPSPSPSAVAGTLPASPTHPDNRDPLLRSEGQRNLVTFDDCPMTVEDCEPRQPDAQEASCALSLPAQDEIDEPVEGNPIHLVQVKELRIFDSSGTIGRYSGTIDESDGKPCGRGRLEYYGGGHWYEGDFFQNLFHGMGACSSPKGDVFRGRFVMGERVDGEMTYPDGSSYQGQWYKGLRHGRGKYKFPGRDGGTYKGEFQEDAMHGAGQLIWPDGGKFVGEWVHGKRHGVGKEYAPDGTLLRDGFWRNGTPIAVTKKHR